MSTDRPPGRGPRWLVGVVLALLLVPGLIGFELWPMTGWRLFSSSRGQTATRWVIEAENTDGSHRLVDPGELPAAYSNVEWILSTVGGGGTARSVAICSAVLDAAHEADDDIVALAIAKDRQRLVQDADGDWAPTHDLEVRERCSRDAS